MEKAGRGMKRSLNSQHNRTVMQMLLRSEREIEIGEGFNLNEVLHEADMLLCEEQPILREKTDG